MCPVLGGCLLEGMLIAIPLLIAILGLLMWALSANPKVAEAGRILFFCGAFVTTLQLGHQKLF